MNVGTYVSIGPKFHRFRFSATSCPYLVTSRCARLLQLRVDPSTLTRSEYHKHLLTHVLRDMFGGGVY